MQISDHFVCLSVLHNDQDVGVAKFVTLGLEISCFFFVDRHGWKLHRDMEVAAQV